jgi:hypothetical protein
VRDWRVGGEVEARREQRACQGNGGEADLLAPRLGLRVARREREQRQADEKRGGAREG